MTNHWLEAIPEAQREFAREAVSAAFGGASVSDVQPVLGGASGALAYRIEVRDRAYLLRLEVRRGPMRNPHQYTCMRIAAEAGLAPAVHYADDAAGASIIGFIPQKPLHEYPGGALGIAEALGELAGKLQGTAPFPVLADYRTIVDRLLTHLRSLCSPGLLDPHVEAFGRIREVYPWDAAAHVSSHNDPNPRNLLFDGERIWLVDWETAFRNDRFTDVAILVDNHGQSPELESAMLRAWLGRDPDRRDRARVRLMRMVTRLYYAGLLLGFPMKPPPTITGLAAPSPEEFQAMEWTPQTGVILGKMCLAGFLAGVEAPDFEEVLTVAGG